MGTKHEVEAYERLTTRPGVEVELGFTKSMGEGTYEFLRYDVRYADTPKEGESLDDVEERLYNKAEAKVVERVRKLDEELGPKRSKSSRIHARDDDG